MINDIKDITSFTWATVTSVAPLRVQLDGDSSPLVMTPDSLVDPRGLYIGARVRVELTQRKVVIHGAANGGGDLATGILDVNYLGPGPARVKVFPDTVLTGPYQWVGKSERYGNRVVTLQRKGNTWVILGHSGEEGLGGKVDLTPYLQNGWQTYNLRNGASPRRWATPRVQKTMAGIVVLSGLLNAGTATAGTVIGTLPAGYRPDTTMLFPINNGDTAKALYIKPDGSMITANGWAANYISLDGIAFPAAGVATWTDFVPANYKNGWSDYYAINSEYGHARYWKDPYGFVWTAGLIRGGTTSTGDLPMVSLPSSVYGSHLQSHAKAACSDSFGFVSVFPNGDICWKIGSTSNSWLSLCGICIVTPDALNNNPWWHFGMVNGWTRYSTTFPQPGILTREDGLTMTKGLVISGTVGQKIFNPPATALPESELILYSVSNQAFNRVDVNGMNAAAEDNRGGFFQMTGSNTWQSLDNHMWMVGD